MADIDRGKMDGFVGQAEHGCRLRTGRATAARASAERVHRRDGLPQRRRHPQLLGLRRHFVLQDHLFEPIASWSLPAHLYMVSAWSALCAGPRTRSSCDNAVQLPGLPPDFGAAPRATEP